MNFKKGASREEPEINLIPLIDLFLVIIIFLMVTTTYSKFAELQITLPTADAEKAQQRPGRDRRGGHAGRPLHGRRPPGRGPRCGRPDGNHSRGSRRVARIR